MKNKSKNADTIGYSNLTFNDFKMLAKNPTLSRHQKVGFPDGYREGKEKEIFDDVVEKLSKLKEKNKNILEIGPGCSNLPLMLSELCRKNNNKLTFIDNEEMLSHLPNELHINKYAGAFPGALEMDMDKYKGNFDVIIAYSVIQYVFAHANLFEFLDKCLILMRDGGEILFGDIPNITMRKRFFSSQAGIKCHQDYTGTSEIPEVRFNEVESEQLDDSIVLAIISRARAQGFHAWVIPQSASLPMANRREDILIKKP